MEHVAVDAGTLFFEGLSGRLWNQLGRLEALLDRFGIERVSLGPVAACV